MDLVNADMLGCGCVLGRGGGGVFSRLIDSGMFDYECVSSGGGSMDGWG